MESFYLPALKIMTGCSILLLLLLALQLQEFPPKAFAHQLRVSRFQGSRPKSVLHPLLVLQSRVHARVLQVLPSKPAQPPLPGAIALLRGAPRSWFLRLRRWLSALRAGWSAATSPDSAPAHAAVRG